MDSADPRLIYPEGCKPVQSCRLGGSWSDLSAITLQTTLRNL